MKEQVNKILDSSEIDQKIIRMAYEIVENNLDEKHIYFTGIKGGGYTLASLLKKAVEDISQLKITLVEIYINKQDPLEDEIRLSDPIDRPNESVVIVIDDVLNSGKTVVYAMKPLLDLNLKKIETAFLVNRAHKLFPISTNYTGTELATTLQEHIKVEWSDKGSSVSLL